MHRSRGLVTAACLLACAAGCSQGTTAAPPPVSTAPSSPASSTPPPPTTTTSAVTRPASPAKLTEACAFLGGEEITSALGTSLPAQAHEEPSKVDGVVTNFQCTYGDLALLTVTAVPDDVTPKSLTDQQRKRCTGAITPMAVGSGGYFCRTPEGFEEILTGKTVHRQVRILDLTLFVPGNRPDAYPALAKLVLDRL
ncbi:hypothetical protein OG738_34665 [Amycolatopsis sp. NBC_01488]|uniref:hypothetical protein n=1 Tax=Amycolatopsis sp. NBC_01488 TaxID=2903563 RepID=UPI002E28650C|nr:hypothetical protein [Amycolatopsis sp. NBC_01488]